MSRSARSHSWLCPFKPPTPGAERRCMAIVLLLFCQSPVILYQSVLLVNLYWHLIDLRIDCERNCYYLIETKTSILDTFPWEFIYDVFILGLDWRKTWSTFTGFKLLSRKTLQHQWEWSRHWIHLHKIDRKCKMQSTQGGGGRSNHIWCWNSCCLQRCWICTGRILHQTLVPYQNMCI